MTYRREDDDLECRVIVELTTGYLDRVLDVVTRRRVARHLRACRGCATYVRQIEDTTAALRRMQS